MNKRVTIFGAGMLVAIATMATVNLTNFSLQQALNQLAGNDVAPYTRYSAQQAANLILANVPEEHDDMIPTVTFVWDDNARELWGEDDSLLVNASGNVKMRIRDILHTFNIDGGLAVEPEAIQHGDTLTTTLSISMVRALMGRGWEAGTVGWDETSGLYNGDVSLLAQGYTTAQADTFYNNIRMAVLAQRDTLGLGAPKWISHSNSSAARITDLAAARNGITYGFSPAQSATVGSQRGVRPNAMYPVEVGRWGAWGTGGAGGNDMAATPARYGNRYEILQSLGEGNDTSATYKTIRRAMQTKGLVVFIGHKPSTWETVLQGQNGFYAFMEYLAALRDAGRIQILTPGDAADYYFRDSVGPFVNFAGSGNFDDLDGDGHYDGWAANRGTFAAADTAKMWVRSETGGHNGKRYVSFTYAGTGVASTAWAGTAKAHAWQQPHVWLSAFPPRGGAWTARFEAWVIADTLGTGYTAISGDTVGVVFGAPHERLPYRWSTGVQNFGWGYDNSGQASHSSASTTLPNGNDIPGHVWRFAARNNFRLSGTNKEWMHIVAEWDVPDGSDYLLVHIWKCSQIPANALLLSDYSVTFHRRGN